MISCLSSIHYFFYTFDFVETSSTKSICSLKCDQVLWVCLVISEDDKHGGVGCIICDAVVQVCAVAGAFVGRRDEAAFALGVVPHQDPGQVHALVPAAVRSCVAVGRVLGVHCEVGAFAVKRRCGKTDIEPCSCEPGRQRVTPLLITGSCVTVP